MGQIKSDVLMQSVDLVVTAVGKLLETEAFDLVIGNIDKGVVFTSRGIVQTVEISVVPIRKICVTVSNHTGIEIKSFCKSTEILKAAEFVVNQFRK